MKVIMKVIIIIIIIVIIIKNKKITKTPFNEDA